MLTKLFVIIATFNYCIYVSMMHELKYYSAALLSNDRFFARNYFFDIEHFHVASLTAKIFSFFCRCSVKESFHSVMFSLAIIEFRFAFHLINSKELSLFD